MNAVEEWNAVRPEANNIMPRLARTVDAAIAELEAENERLKGGRSARIVCLCGSTRFKEQFLAEALRLELDGHIALSMTQFEHADSIEVTAAQKSEYDALHKRKIDLCTEVYVLNVAGYIGESTASEIAYAESLGKSVTYLEPSRNLLG